MEGIAKTHEDIEAQIREIQSKKKEIIIEGDKGVGLCESGYFDSEIYDAGAGKGKYEGYVTSIAANDEVDDEEEDVGFAQKRSSGFGANVAFYNDIAPVDKDFDPLAEHRRPTIADREDEYRQKRRRMIISPERVDPFADGEYRCLLNLYLILIQNILFRLPFILSYCQ